jgi:tetratricopeptide (TPR) repeat protein
VTERSPCRFTGARSRIIVPLSSFAFFFLSVVFPTDRLFAFSFKCETTKSGSFSKEHRRALDLVAHGKAEEALPLLESALEKTPNDVCLTVRYADTLVKLSLYEKAIEIYEKKRDLIDLRFLAGDLGKAFFEKEDYPRAQYLYEEAFARDPSDVGALKGIVVSSCRLVDYVTAEKYLGLAGESKKIPDSVVGSLKVFLLRHMGNPGFALQYAREHGVEDRELSQTLNREAAVDRINWDEFDEAVRVLEQELAADPANVKARADYVVALSKKHRMKEAVDQYAIVEAAGQPISPEVTEAVADAFAYLRKPGEAGKLYRIMLEQSRSLPFKAEMGLFNTHTTLRNWKKAEDAWARINDLLEGGKLNWMEKHEALTSRGWFLISQDRLEEAQLHFEACLREAGLDAGFRSGLAHVYLHRGWPRKALEQFAIAQNTSPEDLPTRVGMAQALSALDRAREASALTSQLYRTYPYDLDVKDLYETIKAREAPQIAFDSHLINEAPGTTEYRFQLIGTAPITPVFKAFADVLHMHSYENIGAERFSTSWDRGGLGLSWLVVPGLTLTEEGSWDYVKQAEFGSTTKLVWQIKDGLNAEGAYESFSLDIPLRARATGVTGKTGLVGLHYAESDVRDYLLNLTGNWLSDGSFNPTAVLRFEQTIINRPNWKVRLAPQFYYARYSKSQASVSYFSPMYEYNISLEPSLEITHYQLYDKSFKSYVNADIGAYKEHGFRFYPVGGISYTQEIKISKTFSIRWIAGYGARVYDGAYSNVFQLFFGISKYF